MNKNIKNFLTVLSFFLLILASRLFLLNSSMDFFDSTQYFWRSASTKLIDAISSGHAPYHPGYIFFTWLTNNLLVHLNINDTPIAAAIPSAIFGTLTIVFFYLLTKEIFNKKIAFFSALLAAITPYFWISNIAIMVDPTMICFYMLSLYLFYLWLSKKNYLFLILSGFAIGYAIWTHTQIAFWSLGFVAIFIYKIKPKEWLKTIFQSLPALLGIIFFIYIYLFLLVRTAHNPTYLSALKYLFTGNAGDHMPLSLKPGMINYLTIMTTLGALFSILGFVKLFFDKKRQKLLMLLIWLIPGLFFSALYLYANLYGRSSMISIFPATIAISYFLTSWKTKNLSIKIFQSALIFLIIIQFLAISIPVVKKYATEPGVYEELGQKQQQLPAGGLYITSNLAKTSSGYAFYDTIWETSLEQIYQDIEATDKKNKPIFIGQDAIMFGFYKYDGNNWEIKSTALGEPGEHSTIAAELFSKYNSNLAASSQFNNKTSTYQLKTNNQSFKERLTKGLNALTDNQSLILGHMIDSNSNNPIARDLINIYSNQTRYIVSPENIKRNDFIYYLYNIIIYKIKKSDILRDPLIFTYSDKSGFFTVILPKNQSQNLDLIASSFNLSTNEIFPGKQMPFQFNSQKDQKLIIDSQKNEEAEKIDEIINTVDLNKSFYLILNKNSNKINYSLYNFSYKVDLSDKLSAITLPSFSDKIISDDSSVSKKVRFQPKKEEGLVVFGPWINLEKGSYKLNFKTKILNPDEDKIGSVSVTHNNTQVLAEKNIETNNLITDSYQDIILNFEVMDKLNGVEFKMNSLGNSDIYLDYIGLSKIK